MFFAGRENSIVVCALPARFFFIIIKAWSTVFLCASHRDLFFSRTWATLADCALRSELLERGIQFARCFKSDE